MPQCFLLSHAAAPPLTHGSIPIGDHAGAAEELRIVWEAVPHDGEILAQYAATRARAGDVDGAVALLRTAATVGVTWMSRLLCVVHSPVFPKGDALSDVKVFPTLLMPWTGYPARPARRTDSVRILRHPHTSAICGRGMSSRPFSGTADGARTRGWNMKLHWRCARACVCVCVYVCVCVCVCVCMSVCVGWVGSLSVCV